MKNLDEGIFSCVSFSNIKELRSNSDFYTERQICEVHDLARQAADFIFSMINEGATVIDAISFLAEDIPRFHYEAPALDIDLLDTAINSFSSIQSDYLSVVFSKMILEEIRSRGVEVSESKFLPVSESDELLTYVKNSLSDEAYDVFSADFENPRAAYSSDLNQAVDSVFDRRCGYCIVPLEEKDRRRIFSVNSLLYKRDLKIVSVISVFGFDGNADMKYALASLNFNIPHLNESDDRYLEILVPVCGGDCLQGILSAAKVYGVEVYRLSSVSYPDVDDEEYYSIIFRRNGSDYSDLLLYLIMYHSNFIPTGLYLNLE